MDFQSMEPDLDVRDSATGRFLIQKVDTKPLKGVREEK